MISSKIRKIELRYNIPEGSVTTVKQTKGRPRKVLGVNVDTIRQVLAYYLRVELRLNLEDIGDVLGFSSHSGAVRAFSAAVRRMHDEDYEYYEYMRSVMRIVDRRVKVKMPERREYQTKQYAIPAIVKKNVSYKEAEPIIRPKAVYSNPRPYDQI